MRINLLKVNLLTLSMLLGGSLYAQEECGSEFVNKIFFEKNPQLKLEYDKTNSKISELNKLGKLISKRKPGEVIEIPVVVHLITDGSPSGTDGNLTDQQVIDWINYTNSLYDGTAQNEKSTFNYPFKLVLAKRTPDNKPTNGINRLDFSSNEKYMQYGFNYQGKNGISEEELTDIAHWEPSSYYNIYVVTKFDEGKSSLNGYARFPSSHGTKYDLAMHGSHVVRVGHATLGHEVGHALGLHHVFGQTTGTTNCITTSVDDPYTTGDLVADTSPTINGNYYWTAYNTNQPIGKVNTCTNEVFDDIIWNVLNYGSQPRVIFTEGQTNRSLAMYEQFRTSFDTSLATQAPSTTSKIPVDASCTPGGNSGYADIKNFSLGTIKLSNFYGTDVYNDFTKKNNINTTYLTEVEEGDNIDLNLSLWGPNNRRKIAVYIDYNGNGTFELDEIALNVTELPKDVYDFTSKIKIPTTTVKNTPLRVRLVADIANVYSGYLDTTYGACDDRKGGQVMDFTLVVKEANSTIWDGTSWSAGLPTPEREGIVRGDLVLNDYVHTNKFTLESGSVTLNNSMLVNEVINNLTADKFVIKSHGLYQQSSTDKAIGEFTVIQNSSPMILNDATLWSSPVTGQNLRSFSPKTLLKRFYKYDEAANGFSSLFVNDPLYPNSDIKDPNTYNFETGLGYHIRVSADQSTTVASEFEGKFVGELNNGKIQIPTTVNSFGYNLVGNPYPSAISALNFLNANPDVETLYFWTQQSPLTANGYASNNYATYTRAGGVSAAAGNETPNGNISKGQGFFVEMLKPGNIVFENYMRSVSGTGGIVMHKNGEETEAKRVRLDLFEGTQAKNQILIAYMDEATNGFDHQIDGKVNLMFEGSKFYSLIDNSTNKFSIQGRDVNELENDIVRIGFEAKTTGVYTIKLADVENISNQSIYLKDKKDNQLVDLTKTSYQFNSEVGTFEDRFELVYSTETLGTSETDNLSNGVNVVKTSSGLKVVSTKELSTIEVFDISGRKVFAKEVKGTEVLISGLIKSNQLLVVKVTTKEGKMVKTKVIY